jgi:hypothetical protein
MPTYTIICSNPGCSTVVAETTLPDGAPRPSPRALGAPVCLPCAKKLGYIQEVALPLDGEGK